MDYEFEMEEPFIVTTADMLEIAASGGNGSEYVDIVGLMENAAKELREKDAEIDRLRKDKTELMFDPSIKMLLAGKKALFRFVEDPTLDDAREIYMKMIDAFQQKEKE